MTSIKPKATTEVKEEGNYPKNVWRDSMEDSSIAVYNYSIEVKEKESNELKDWRADFDKIISTNINPTA